MLILHLFCFLNFLFASLELGFRVVLPMTSYCERAGGLANPRRPKKCQISIDDDNNNDNDNYCDNYYDKNDN